MTVELRKFRPLHCAKVGHLTLVDAPCTPCPACGHQHWPGRQPCEACLLAAFVGEMFEARGSSPEWRA